MVCTALYDVCVALHLSGLTRLAKFKDLWSPWCPTVGVAVRIGEHRQLWLCSNLQKVHTWYLCVEQSCLVQVKIQVRVQVQSPSQNPMPLKVFESMITIQLALKSGKEQLQHEVLVHSCYQSMCLKLTILVDLRSSNIKDHAMDGMHLM